MTSLTAAARALKERQKNRNLPTVEVPEVEEDELARTLQGIQEHLRMYEGDSGAPKERFVTIAELENSGLIKSDVKGRFAFISQVLETDVAQMAGSTSNPTTKDPVPKDTSRTSRTPSGGGSKTQSAVSTAARLNDAQDVNVANPAKNEFLYYDGNKFTNFPLFAKDNIWSGSQHFNKPLRMREQASGPAALEGLGYLWLKDDDPNTLRFTDDAGTEVQLGPNGEFDYVQFDILYSDGTAEGRLQWNSEDGTLEVGMPGGNVNLQIGQEQMIRCRNTTGVEISNGSLVYIIGASGNKPLIALADADTEATSHVLGFATENIAHNDNGYVTLSGLVRDVDTLGMAAGDTIYLSSTAGEFTTTKPTAPAHGMDVGEVIAVHETEGVVLAHIGADVRIDHASDVILDSIAPGEILKWDGSTFVNNTLYEITQAELDAGLTIFDIVDGAKLPGLVLRYGNNLIPADTDMTTAARNAMLAYLDVTFPSEAIKCTGELTFRSGHHLHGGGMGVSKLILDGTVTASHGLLYANSGGSSTFVTDIQVSDLTLDGLVATASFSEHQHLCSISGVDGALFTRVKFLGFRGDGLYVGSVNGERHNKNIVVDSSCVFDGVNNDNRNGITVVDCDVFSCVGALFRDMTRSTMPGAFDAEPNNNTYHVLKNIKFDENIIINVTGSAGAINFILTAATYTTQPENLSANGNIFDVTVTAIVFDSNANYARPINLSFVGNTGKVGNYCDVQGRLEGLTYSGNTLYATGRGFLGFNPTDELIDATINANTITGNGSTTKGWVLRSGNNINFSGGTYKGLVDFTYQLSTSGSILDDVKISNEIVADGNGVEFGAGTVTGVQITNNDFTKAANAIEGTIPADTVIRDNSGIDEIVTSTNVITAIESGRTFYLNAVGGFTSTLPAPHRGLKYKFIVSTAPTTAYIITTTSGANVLFGTFIDIVGELVYFSAQDVLNFVASASVVGDYMEVESDGTNWYCVAKSGADGGITTNAT